MNDREENKKISEAVKAALENDENLIVVTEQQIYAIGYLNKRKEF